MFWFSPSALARHYYKKSEEIPGKALRVPGG
jgi:hypothetical protein